VSASLAVGDSSRASNGYSVPAEGAHRNREVGEGRPPLRHQGGVVLAGARKKVRRGASSASSTARSTPRSPPRRSIAARRAQLLADHREPGGVRSLRAFVARDGLRNRRHAREHVRSGRRGHAERPELARLDERERADSWHRTSPAPGRRPGRSAPEPSRDRERGRDRPPPSVAVVSQSWSEGP
jgi:hypothetical protein